MNMLLSLLKNISEKLKIYGFVLSIVLANTNYLFGNVLTDNNKAGTCEAIFTPDLPLLPSNENIEADINAILNLFLDDYLGKSAPSSNALSSAAANYDKLNIVVSNGEITGINISSYESVPFLKTFAQQLRKNPTDEDTKEKANNTIWLLTRQICAGTLKVDGNCYEFREFANNAVVLYPYLDKNIKSLFDYAMDQHKAFKHFWEPAYDKANQESNGTINTDIMYNLGTAIMVFAASQTNPDERYRWMKGYKRWVERFASYTNGTADGIKIDGTGFHHWTAYDGYMYSFKTACNAIYYLSGTGFEISKENYLFFRNAVYAQIIQSNESGVKALSMVGRNPQNRSINYSDSSVKKLALAGGKILGLSTADPILAGEYNRIWRVSADFKYPQETPLSQSSGFYQLNHANAGIFRKDDWLVVMKGFSSALWGAELYATSNRYGRYQSYGALEIIYPGEANTGNGYDVNTWNWNYNPGATTIVLPWNKLHGERERIDEYQEYDFAGALAFNKKNSDVLNRTHGTWGVFAMDFKEIEGLGWGTTHGPNAHNKTFRFKKSTFAIGDIIICLASNISNSDNENPTVTTLFQRLDNSSKNVVVNGSSQDNSAIFSGESNNWLISNYGTGFYVFEGNDEVKLWNGFQQTPNQNQTNPDAYTSNATGKYWIGHINHGTNPQDADYEYVIVPNGDKNIMTHLDGEIKKGNKPYTVHHKNANAHIVEHKSGVWGYAIFNEDSIRIYDAIISHVNYPCLIMYEEIPANGLLKMAISNPSMGFTPRSYKASVEKLIKVTLKGKWTLNDNGGSDINLVYKDQSSELTIKTNDGLPEEFELKWDGPLLKSLKINGAVPSGWNSFKFKTNVRLANNKIPDLNAIPLDSADKLTITSPAGVPGNARIEVENEGGMKKMYTISFTAPESHIEDFEKLEGSGMLDTYFVGNNNQMWYVNGRSGEYLGSGNSVYFYPEQGGVVSENIPGGISSFSFEAINYRSADSERIIEVYINDSLIVRQANSQEEKTVIKADGLEFYPNAVFKIVNASENGRIIAVDNISWNGYAPDRNAYLEYIKVNGDYLEDFDPAKNLFYADVSEVTNIEAVAQSEKASVDVIVPPDTTGVIQIHVTAQDGSWNDYIIDFKKVLSSVNGVNLMSIKVYPNPAKHFVYIEGDFPENCVWELIGLNGIKFKSGLVSSRRTRITLDENQNGIYLLRVLSDNKIINTQKLVLY